MRFLVQFLFGFGFFGSGSYEDLGDDECAWTNPRKRSQSPPGFVLFLDVLLRIGDIFWGLQKYSIYLRRLGGVSQHQGNMNHSFMTGQEPSFGPLNGFDHLQALAAASHLPAQSLGLYEQYHQEDLMSALLKQV
ncbi:unnamed protein product [Microthlaspi erraticum]|uniref:Uncharacterized protein n=1 Tax=Microthlaspi erraticum TaxID=1685480 RepID=A0A6D2KW51_9BRAS|nr:unnamed protein product [Microthlaspi erraticum]